MQILFVHPNFPAQFGPALTRLARMPDVECVFVSRYANVEIEGVRRVPSTLRGGATKTTHYCSRTFENAVWQAHAVHEACRDDPAIRPDLIVGHSGFGSTAMLRELYDCPVVNLFEYFYRPHDSDMDFRPEFPPREIDYLRSRMRNAMILIDLEQCDAGYTPTPWQRALFPQVYQPKLEVIHDGIDLDLWRRRQVPRVLGDETIPDDVRIVTYVSRGFEAMRGFDIFVRVANRIAAERPDVIFVCVGADRVHYGNDQRHIEAPTFREHVLRAERPDLGRFRFPGKLPPEQLAELFSISDLHVYLTAPFVLSWSVLDALACECTVLASDTAPVRDFLRHEENALLAGFFDVDALVARALEVLADPAGYRELGRRGRAMIEENLSLDRTFPRLWELFQRTLRGERS